MVDNQVKPNLNTIAERDQISMPILTHKFDNFFFHPTKPGVMVCLEKNMYPSDLESYHLQSMQEEKRMAPY
jgi:hypothetical protein